MCVGGGEIIGRVEEEWSRFIEVILGVAEVICETGSIREGKKRKGSEWWNEEIRRVDVRKKERFRCGRGREKRRLGRVIGSTTGVSNRRLKIELAAIKEALEVGEVAGIL